MTITRLTFTPTQLTEEVNSMKEIFLDRMVRENIISKDSVSEMNKYCFVIIEKGFFGKVWDKIFFKKDEDKSVKIIIVKVSQ